MEQTSTVDDCLLVGVSLNLGNNIFSLEELVIGTQTDSQIDSSKVVCQKMSRKSEDKKSAKEKTSSLIPVEKGGSYRFENRVY